MYKLQLKENFTFDVESDEVSLCLSPETITDDTLYENLELVPATRENNEISITPDRDIKGFSIIVASDNYIKGYINLSSVVELGPNQKLILSAIELNNIFEINAKVEYNLNEIMYDHSVDHINSTVFSKLSHSQVDINNLLSNFDKNVNTIGRMSSDTLQFTDFEGFIFNLPESASQKWSANLKFNLNMTKAFTYISSRYQLIEVLSKYTYLGSNIFDGVSIYSIVPTEVEGDIVKSFSVIYSGCNNCHEISIYNITDLEFSLTELTKIQRPILIAFFNSFYLNINNLIYYICPKSSIKDGNYVVYNTNVTRLDIPGVTKYCEFSDFSYIGINYNNGEFNLVDYKGNIYPTSEFNSDKMKDYIPNGVYDVYDSSDMWTNLGVNLKIALLMAKRQIVNNRYSFEDLYFYDNFLLRHLNNGYNYIYPFSPYVRIRKINLPSRNRIVSSNNYIFSEDNNQYYADYLSGSNGLVTRKGEGYLFTFRGLLLKINENSVEVLNGKITD